MKNCFFLFVIQLNNALKMGRHFKFILFSTGKNLELGLKKAGVLSFLRDLDGNDEDPQCETLLKEASTQATGN